MEKEVIFKFPGSAIYYPITLFNDNTCIVHSSTPSEFMTAWKWYEDKVMFKMQLSDGWTSACEPITEGYKSYLKSLLEK